MKRRIIVGLIAVVLVMIIACLSATVFATFGVFVVSADDAGLESAVVSAEEANTKYDSVEYDINSASSVSVIPTTPKTTSSVLVDPGNPDTGANKCLAGVALILAGAVVVVAKKTLRD